MRKLTKSSRVGVLMGGISEEREVSLKSGAAMTEALRRMNYTVITMDVDQRLPERLVLEKIDFAVIALHGALGEDGSVQGLLEVMGIPYTGSGVAASALCMDKLLSKRMFRDEGLLTPPWRHVTFAGMGKKQIENTVRLVQTSMNWPVYVKPRSSGSSLGVVQVTDADALLKLFLKWRQKQADMPSLLVEEGIFGTEVTATILNGLPLPLIEIRVKKGKQDKKDKDPEGRHGFYDFSHKYTTGHTEYLSPPPDLKEETSEWIIQTALSAYRCLGCRGMIRVDIIVDRNGWPWLLEVNTLPGMTEISLAPKAAEAAGIGFDEFVKMIVTTAD